MFEGMAPSLFLPFCSPHFPIIFPSFHPFRLPAPLEVGILNTGFWGERCKLPKQDMRQSANENHFLAF